MGFLDRIKGVLSGQQGSDPKGPLGLLPGDTVRYYQDSYTVAGIRVVHGTSGRRWQYVLTAAAGPGAVLVVRDTNIETWSLQKLLPIEGLPWAEDSWIDEDDTPLRLATTTKERVRVHGDPATESAREVVTRRFVDEDEETTLLLETWGGYREGRLGEPVYEGELEFDSNATVDDAPWAQADAESDPAVEAADDDVSKGSPLAAALALEGRVALERSATPDFVEDEEESYSDSEWGDALDVAPETQQIAVVAAASVRRDACPDWLVPTRWVAGSGHDDVDDLEDDWLRPQQ